MMSFISLEGYEFYPKKITSENDDLHPIDFKKINSSEFIESEEPQNRLIFVMSGEILLSVDGREQPILQKNQFVFIPSNQKITILANQDSALITLRLHKGVNLKQYYNLKERAVADQDSDFYVIECSELLYGHLKLLQKILEKNLADNYYLNLKLNELLLSFGWFYSKEELTKLFASQLSKDCDFASYIINNGYKYQSIGELAKDMNYSISGFDKKFKRVFGVSGYKYIKAQKAKRVLQSIYSDKLSFKEIAETFNFSSESYFYEFCKTEFGKTPGEIRRSHNPNLVRCHL